VAAPRRGKAAAVEGQVRTAAAGGGDWTALPRVPCGAAGPGQQMEYFASAFVLLANVRELGQSTSRS